MYRYQIGGKKSNFSRLFLDFVRNSIESYLNILRVRKSQLTIFFKSTSREKTMRSTTRNHFFSRSRAYKLVFQIQNIYPFYNFILEKQNKLETFINVNCLRFFFFKIINENSDFFSFKMFIKF